MDAPGSETHETPSAANGAHTATDDASDAPSPAVRLGRIEKVLRTVLAQIAPVEGDRDGVARRQDLARLHGSLAQKMKTLQDEVEVLKADAAAPAVEPVAEEEPRPEDPRIEEMARQLEAIEGFLFVQLDERLESFTRHMAAEATPERFVRILLLVLALSGASLALAIAGLFV